MKLGTRSTVLIGVAAVGISFAAGAFLLLTPRPSPDGNRFGSVHFPISCASVQDKFDHAVGLLHNFFYPETVKAFQAVIAEDPDCAIAYWGLAISQRPNPLVPPFPAANMKAASEAVTKGKAAAQTTPRERAYLEAIELYYKDYDTVDHRTRVGLYEQAMQWLSEQYPDDAEAKIFYALALNESVDLNDKGLTKQRKAAAILNEEAKTQPNHPGIAHYIIHSYDYATLAALCLPTANLYGQLASSAPHALHMPSHIYSMLGMWDESIRANLDSEAASRAWAEKNAPGSVPPRNPHGMDFRTYAYLQLGDDKSAAQVVNDAATVTSPAEASLTFDTALAAIPARYALERGRWDDAAQIPVRESRHLPALSISRFTRALGAARAGRSEEARAELAELQAIEQRLIDAGDTYWSQQARIQIGAATAWIMLSEKRPDEALAAMTAAAEQDDASEKNIAMENKLLPMRELLGELYLALGRGSEAAGAFDVALTASPNRFRTVAGAARAARAQSSIEDAKRHYRALIGLARNADPNTPDIVEARTYLSEH
jgi:hypothetical protein